MLCAGVVSGASWRKSAALVALSASRPYRPDNGFSVYSVCLNGHSSTVAMRPARLSVIPLTIAGELEPVRRKRPFSVRRSSMTPRSTRNSSGYCWASSMITRSRCRLQNAVGSLLISW
ncbi:MAG: hypothetical protein ACD_75C02065G0001 [uncultured bacterium]|nr:MAG: hypothetical protein ACD_75C02065G0001 [uncultured bacterium]